MGGGVAATGGFLAAQPVRSRQTERQTFLMPLFSLSPDRLSMAILVTRPNRGSKHLRTNPWLSFAERGRLRFLRSPRALGQESVRPNRDEVMSTAVDARVRAQQKIHWSGPQPVGNCGE